MYYPFISQERDILGFKGNTVSEIITEAFNEQNDVKLRFAIKCLNHIIYQWIPDNKNMQYYFLSIRDYCVHEYHYIWKRHNQLINI